MTTYKLILPSHMNQYGGLFGGHLLRWVDEAGWMAVTMDHPGKRFVTVGLSEVVFKKQVMGGTILRFETELLREGRTSVTYTSHVYRNDLSSGDCIPIFTTQITFVRIDAAGNKMPIADPPED